jgi:hypothetical protein
VLVAGIAVSAGLGLSGHGVKVVGKIPTGLPAVSVPHLAVSDLWVLAPSATGMMLVIFSEALGAGQAFADKHGCRLDSSQEMLALGPGQPGLGRARPGVGDEPAERGVGDRVVIDPQAVHLHGDHRAFFGVEGRAAHSEGSPGNQGHALAHHAPTLKDPDRPAVGTGCAPHTSLGEHDRFVIKGGAVLREDEAVSHSGRRGFGSQ